jgi:hypothetical protein
MDSKMLSEIRDEMMQKYVDLLLAYRRNCAASTPPTQVRHVHSLRPDIDHAAAHPTGQLQTSACVRTCHYQESSFERYGVCTAYQIRRRTYAFMMQEDRFSLMPELLHASESWLWAAKRS